MLVLMTFNDLKRRDARGPNYSMNFQFGTVTDIVEGRVLI